MDTKGFNEIIIYEDKDGLAKIDVKIEADTLWLTQLQIAELFGVKKPAVSKHLTNIFKSGELDKNSVVSKMETTASDSYKIRGSHSQPS